MTDLCLPPAARSSTDHRAVLHDLLEQALAWPSEYDAGLSSHLPMALEALDGLGADAATMQRFMQRYARRFERLPAGNARGAAAVTALTSDWPAWRGRFEALPALRAHFDAAMARVGREALLREALPLLVSGAGGAAFHGAIRVAHAVAAGHDGELAAALAYWASRWMPLDLPPPAARAFHDPAPWLDAIDARLLADDPTWSSAEALIMTRMPAATRTHAWRSLAGAFDGAAGATPAAFDGLIRSAALRYASTRSFTVLHLVTGARALRELAAWLPDQPAWHAPIWHAVAAASIASRVAWTDGASFRAEPPPASWPDVIARAAASDDDHVIKLVHAVACEQARRPDDAWLAAARRAVGGA